MGNADHKGMKKIQAWVKSETWDSLVSLGYTSPTTAVTEAFDILLRESLKDPNESPEDPPESQSIPELRATIEGLHLLLEEKNQRIEDLRKDKETLSIFAHYFKSLEYKRIEGQGYSRDISGIHEGDRNTEHQESQRSRIKKADREEHQEAGEKPVKIQDEARTGTAEKPLIEKVCKNCGEPFLTENPRKETCSDRCRSQYSRKHKKAYETEGEARHKAQRKE